ncbi:hypothetical protein C8D89_111123 [Actinomycetospora cinnamomea]|uniref:Uncharacterized protein n=1 Tax=Actinomycetospora cinnamomea TaxID=663609 RepID=A0A2U1F6H8_9PSEU|nr:hypothetical protein C8D89_111123 [Actinomycetospora cinnamomea]
MQPVVAAEGDGRLRRHLMREVPVSFRRSRTRGAHFTPIDGAEAQAVNGLGTPQLPGVA